MNQRIGIFPGQFLLILFFAAVGAFPASGDPEFSLDFLWSGSWEYGGSLIDRGDVRLHAHGPALTLRAQGVDKRPAPPGEGFDQGMTAFSGGLYHDTTGSRIIHGILDEGGLPARIRNIWNRGMPYVEQHPYSVSDLRIEPSSTGRPGTYLYLGSPWLGPVRGFGSLLLDADTQAAYDGGIEVRLKKATTLRLEGFYTQSHLPPRTSSAWFSETPPLPERDTRLFAGTVFFTSPEFAAAGDLAWSETFAYGKDLYGNLALRLGNRPWRLSLAADGAGSRYVARDGKAPGAGFRAAARLERRGKRSSLFRASSTLRAAALGEGFYKSSSLFSYYFPAAGKNSPRVWPSRVSLTLNRDAADPEKILDSLDGLMGLRLRKLSLTVQGNLTGSCSSDTALGEDGRPVPFPGFDYPHTFNSAKISGEAAYTAGPFQFGTKLGCKIKKEKDDQWETALSASVRGKPGRFSVKASSADFPRDWDLVLSWRIQH
jgi:hypothetical protein